MQSSVDSVKPLFPLRTGAHSRVLTALLILATPGWTQQPAPGDEVRPVPAGVRLNSISTYWGRDWLQSPGIVGGDSSRLLWLQTGGITADLLWHIPGRRSDATLRYGVGYTYSQGFVTMRGFDHTLTFALRTQLATRTAFTLTASGESRLMSDALFAPTRSQTLTQEAPSADQLGNGLTDGGLAAVSDSPVDLAFSGARRTSGAVTAGFTHTHSPRLMIYASIGAARILRASFRDPESSARFPSATFGQANAGMNFALSRRTRIIGTGTYTRSYARLARSQWETGTLALERSIGRRSFGRLEGGYGRLSDAGPGGGRNTYTAGVGVGTIQGFHTLLITVRRGIGNLTGLLAGSSLGGEAAWTWARPGIRWSATGSVAYERVQGRQFGLVQAWVYHASLSRALSDHFSVMVDAVHANDSGRNAVNFVGRGFRVSCVWSPSATPNRRRR